VSDDLTPPQAILKKSGPLDSQAFSEGLVSAGHAASPAAARKLIERARKSQKIKSTYPVRFDKSILYFLGRHEGTQYARCVKRLLRRKPAFDRVFKAILANKGWITTGQIGKASGCLPTDDKSSAGGRQPLETVVKHLLLIGLVDSVAGERGIFRIGKQFGTASVKRAAFRKKIELETSLLYGFRDWLRNCFLIAYNSHTLRPDDESAAEFNQTLCDLHGPIFFGPFAQAKPLKRGSSSGNFVVAEIVGYRRFTMNDAEATLERVGSMGHRWKSIALCPMVLAPVYSKPAWTALRTAGVVALTFKDVFGPNIAELMRRFWSAISVEEPTPQNLDAIEESLALTNGTIMSEGFIGNLKGALFELLVALGFRATGYDTTLQKIVRRLGENEEFEIDVVARRGDATCKLLECKGRHSEYEECQDDVERHFRDRCRAAADAYGWNVKDLYGEVEAIFITSGRLDSKAAAYAESVKSSHGISCSVMERSKLLEFLEESREKRLIEIIKRYY